MDVPLPFSQPVSSETERRSNTYESPLFIHLQICTDDELLIEGAGMSGLDFNDNQATTLDYVTIKSGDTNAFMTKARTCTNTGISKEIKK